MNMNKKQLGLIGALVAAGSLASASAFAALPAAAGTAVTAMQADGQAVFDLIFPVIAALVGLSVVIKLFKRFGNKV